MPTPFAIIVLGLMAVGFLLGIKRAAAYGHVVDCSPTDSSKTSSQETTRDIVPGEAVRQLEQGRLPAKVST